MYLIRGEESVIPQPITKTMFEKKKSKVLKVSMAQFHTEKMNKKNKCLHLNGLINNGCGFKYLTKSLESKKPFNVKGSVYMARRSEEKKIGVLI